MFRNHEAPRVINRISQEDSAEKPFLLATGNRGKLEEYSLALGLPVDGIDLKVLEVQHDDPEVVLREKATQAWVVNGGEPVWVEDSSLSCEGLSGLPGPFADTFTDAPEKRDALIRSLGEERKATFRVGMAIFDGENSHVKWGSIDGHIAKTRRGEEGFGFDDIFIPGGQTDRNGNLMPPTMGRTYAQMSPLEKLRFNPRQQIVASLRENPVVIDTRVFALPEPDPIQLDHIERELLAENEKAVQFAFDLQAIKGTKPDPEFRRFERQSFTELKIGKQGRISQIVVDPESADGGIVVTPWDKSRESNGKPKRLDLNEHDELRFVQMPDACLEMATAIRAEQFARYHNEKFYSYVREWKRGMHPTEPRGNTHSEVIESVLDIRPDRNGTLRAHRTAAFNEFGYARQYSDEVMSRNNGPESLMVDTSGILTSVFSAGGMPPVSGNLDVVKSMAMTFHEVHIPRNGVFIDAERRVRLFQEAVSGIDALELPADIRELVIGQIGISIGCQNPEEVINEVRSMYDAGCRSVRIYTTNPDRRVPDTAQAIRQTFGKDMRITVAPIVDLEQAEKLINPNIKVNKLIAGHGGGENCTSLKGGGAANAPELSYLMSIDERFNDTAIGLEGGTGHAIGVPLGYVDNISLNGRLIDGGPIEVGGGLMIKHSRGDYAQPYHGSASALTQWIETELDPEIAKRRLNKAAKMRNIEGEPNYKFNVNSVHSIFDNLLEAERLAKVALADQGARNINELRKGICEVGYDNHRVVTSNALVIAGAHR